MIPVSLRLEGFLSYKKMETPIRFDGAKLWMLSGLNGAGKSTIFDAITFALYGVHRGGNRTNYNGLICRGSNSLYVEFEFRANGKHYRVKRSRSRSDKKSCEAREFIDGKWSQVIFGTDNDDGLRKWVQGPEVVGMDENGFLASVLLRQGDADKLLTTAPAARGKILSQILDLSAYQRLQKRASEREGEYRKEERRLVAEISQKPVVTNEEIKQAKTAESEAEQQYQQWRVMVEKLITLLEQAKQWNVLQKQRVECEEALRQADDLQKRELEIEANAARYEALEEALPLLKALWEANQHLETLQSDLERTEQAADGYKRAVEDARSIQDKAQAEKQSLTTVDEALQIEQNNANAILADLAPAVAELSLRNEAQKELRKIESQLEALPNDLFLQVTQAVEWVRQLEEMKLALTPLRQYCRERRDWHKANQEMANAEVAIQDAEVKFSRVEEERCRADMALAEARKIAETRKQEVTAARTRLHEAEKRRDNFAATKDQAQCLFCGQELRPEHREHHEQSLAEEINTAQTTYQAAQQVHEQAEGEAQQKQGAVTTWKTTLEEKQTAREEAKNALREAKSKIDQTCTAANQALENLPYAYLKRIRLIESTPIQGCFASPYPTKEEFHEMEAQVKTLPDRFTEREALQTQLKERDRLNLKRDDLYEKVNAPRQYLPRQSPEDVWQANSDAEKTRNAASRESNGLKPLLEAANKKLEEAKGATNSAQTHWHEFVPRIQEQRELLQQQEIEVARRGGTVPDTWKQEVQHLTAEQLTRWGQEQDALTAATEERKNLHRVQQKATIHRTHLTQVNQDIETIPQAAHRSVEEVDIDMSQARQEAEAQEKAHTEARKRREELERLREATEKLEIQRQEATRSTRLHSRLLGLLDDKTGLQRCLVSSAMDAIVEHANNVLNSLSGGEMSLKLKEEGNDLNLTIIKAGQVADPYETVFLSGGEQFRVAVSLALGIGRYASKTGQRTPSVIIDEGFGCLDDVGRHDVIEALTDMKDHLEKIIVVSHQQEFYDRFSDRYIITKDEEGFSQIKLA
ncbi:MAG: hypothetical protein JWL77_3094 [Chthonomonadaceae bacterium]|nr:hypothetical protein [Chthonomonadaceae bacterium]